MTPPSVTYNTFTIERAFPSAPARVFSAFANATEKALWMNAPDDEPVGDDVGHLEFDFRVGGRERFEFIESVGRKMSYEALYYDIVQDRRIVYCYEMYADDARISVSLATIEVMKDVGGSALTWTEQGAYLDGLDKPELREGGTSWLLDNIADYLVTQDARDSSNSHL
jgi:uncharacterized protein YndB with AHSA1/START domain